MTERPLGPVVPGWSAAADPAGHRLQGHWADLRPLDAAADSAGLWRVFAGHDWVWDYLGSAPPPDLARFQNRMTELEARRQSPCYVIRAKGDPTPLGYACFWTVVRETGNVEIGNVNLSPGLQGTRIATEAFSLMAHWAFDNGYRRLEWKCNALNAPSRRAAQRLGFSFEGIFRQHQVVQGRNRDTAWFAMTDGDWAAIKGAHKAWLDPANFDQDGRQRKALGHFTAPHLVARDPSLSC